jgi:hypothetical protein
MTTAMKANDVVTTWHGMVPRLLNEHKSQRVCEVGVWRGKLSRLILEKCPEVQHLLLVDAWEVVYGNDPRHGWMVFGPGTDNQEMADAYRTVQEGMAPYGERVTVLKRPSVKAAEVVLDGSLDAVLIDALHTYHACKEDILAWIPKLRKGGLMIGDDYSEWFPGVQVAVEEIFGANHRVMDQTWWTFPHGRTR